MRIDQPIFLTSVVTNKVVRLTFMVDGIEGHSYLSACNQLTGVSLLDMYVVNEVMDVVTDLLAPTTTFERMKFELLGGHEDATWFRLTVTGKDETTATATGDVSELGRYLVGVTLIDEWKEGERADEYEA